MKGIYLALGSNLGNREKFLDEAQAALLKAGIEIISKSSVLETKPLAGLDQPKYLNMVIEVETDLSPKRLLQKCQQIENKLGRERAEKWASRTIDIDILFYGDIKVDLPDLKIPHPGIKKRDFVMRGLKECGVTVDEL